MDQEFRQWLMAKLNEKQWSQAEFARRTGKRPSVVSAWIRGERIPDPESCDIIADVLLVPLDTVLEKAGHRPRMETPAEQDEERMVVVYRALPKELRKVVIEFAEFQLQQWRRRR